MCLSLALVLCSTAYADDLGQLLTSAAERTRLDARNSPTLESAATGGSAEHIIINGTLRGSDGKRIVWVNGAPIHSDQAKDLTLLRDGRVQLNLQNGTKTLKPGQTLDQSSGKISEYQTPAPVVAQPASHETASAAATPVDSTPSPAAAAAPAPANTANGQSAVAKPVESATTKAK